MENLKNTINKTETLLNNVKLAKDKINETVVRGGGITSKSLSEIPNNIKNMISKNYKKIAIVDKNVLLTSNESWKEFSIDLNLNFKPSRVICRLENNNRYDTRSSIDSTMDYSADYAGNGIGSNADYYAYITQVSQKGFKLFVKNRRSNSPSLKQVIAIE